MSETRVGAGPAERRDGSTETVRGPRAARPLWLGGGMPSLTRAEATARAALLAVDAMEVDLDLDRGAEVFGSRTTIRFTCREPRGVDLRRAAAARAARGDAQRPPARPGIPGRRPADPHRPRRRQRARGRGDDGLQPRRAGPAPQHRPRRRRGLRLRPPLPRRGTDRVRLLRPARPQGALHRRRHRARRRGRCSATAPPRVVAPGRTELATTLPLATYFVTVCAGP